MPNHITNKVYPRTSGKKLETILETIRSENRIIDFEKIIPMPENIFRGNLGNAEREQYGRNNWYDWSIEHWGTKWNAYDGSYNEFEKCITFDTAWAMPSKIIVALSEMFPDVEFYVEYADEDVGHNCGFFTIKNGKDYDWDAMEKGSVEAEMFAIRLKGYLNDYGSLKELLEEWEVDLERYKDYL